MIWVAWRQVRFQTLVILGALVVIAIYFGLTGPHLSHEYLTSVSTCRNHGDCGSVYNNFQSQYHWGKLFGVLVLAAPALMGIFWGAPLVARELESGTYRLAWTQSVSRSRWLLTKLCLVGLTSMIVAGLLSLMYTWFTSAYLRVFDGQFLPVNYLTHDVVPIGYAAFAFALGVALGAIIRRPVAAMATTLVGYVVFLTGFTLWVRPHLITPVRRSTAFPLPFSGRGQGAPIGANDLVVSQQTVNAAGRVIGQNGGIGPNGATLFSPVRGAPPGTTRFNEVGICPNKFPVHPITANPPSRTVGNLIATEVNKCVRSFHLREVLRYQPVSRYWTFQWYELTIFIVLALLLGAFSWWWVRRRIS
jgi:hypothetical protein